MAIIAKLVDSYNAAQSQQSFVKPAYAPGAYWKIILENTALPIRRLNLIKHTKSECFIY